MLAYLLLGLLAFVLVGWAKRKGVLSLPTWRIGAGVVAVAAFSAALYCGLRGMWIPTVVLGILGLWCAVSARHPRQPTTGRPQPTKREPMSPAEARSILGVEDGASEAQIKAAYTRLMQRVHPDAGGAEGLAIQLNLARDRLLKR